MGYVMLDNAESELMELIREAQKREPAHETAPERDSFVEALGYWIGVWAAKRLGLPRVSTFAYARWI